MPRRREASPGRIVAREERPLGAAGVGDTDEAAVGVVAAGRATGEEEAVARRVGLGRQRRRQPGGDGEDLDGGSDGRRIHGHE
jgi:hypothetical protein